MCPFHITTRLPPQKETTIWNLGVYIQFWSLVREMRKRATNTDSGDQKCMVKGEKKIDVQCFGIYFIYR